MHSPLLGQNTHKWKEQAAYMFAKREKNTPERRDLEKRKMRRMKTKNRVDDIPFASAGDYSILSDASSILAPYSPTAHDESFLDRLLWENAERTDAVDFSLADQYDADDVQTARTYTIHPPSEHSSSAVARYYSDNQPSPLDDSADAFALLVDGLQAIALLAQYLLENPVILITFGSTILFLLIANL